ncbi:MAG: GNAT family N-acetyltransferase [Gemmatimonadaceae bacterium]|jgi:RimJ/RimL family protein N-acetyltransferase|nr:GNAT family N-acetyltransferase [Gemmatimonadaceae bacterium]
MTNVHGTLESARLRLRPATADDAAALAAVLDGADVRPFPWDDCALDADRVRALLADVAAAGAPHGVWFIDCGRSGATCGCVGLLPPGTAAEADERLMHTSEPVVALQAEHRGVGHATEALTLVLARAFHGHGWVRLAAAVAVDDAAARRLAERLGFRALGETDGPRGRLRTYILDRQGFLAADVEERPERGAA